MHISWLGTTAVRLQTKPLDQDIGIIIDPYKPTAGSFPRSLTPNIALYTRGEKGSITLSGKPFTLATPGECETKGVLIAAVQGESADHVMMRIDTEHMSLGHLGLASKQPTDAQLEVLSGVDILCVPVGNKDTYDAEAAMKAVNAIEPRVIIPMAFKSDNDPKAATVDSFVKAMGMSADKPEKKVIIKKKDLPNEETHIIVLAKE